jgi:ectoine hydroxylase-related dioxygenase (phytanoyl-CoA dioxygenase family)
MDMQTTLSAFGVTSDSLDDSEKRQLDERGYLPLPGVMSLEQVLAIRGRVKQLIAEEGEEAGSEFGQEKGAVRLANLVDKDPLFEVCFSHPRVLAAMNHVLEGDFKLSSLNGRASVPGDGIQAFHVDWHEVVKSSGFQVCNSIWLLVDFTEANGATRVVPGSHRSGQNPKDILENPWAKHPDEILLTGEAGTVVVFNSHLWHAGTSNNTESPRYALHSYFTRRHNEQQSNQKAFLSEATLARLSPEARFILDV